MDRTRRLLVLLSLPWLTTVWVLAQPTTTCSTQTIPPTNARLKTCTTKEPNGHVSSIVVTCNDALLEKKEFDENGWPDGDFQSGTCFQSRPGMVITVRGTFSHGVLNGPFYSFNCFFVAEGEFRKGLRWGTWHFTPKNDPNCLRIGGVTPAPSIPAIKLVEGTGSWSAIAGGLSGEDGALTNGVEEGLWRYFGIDGSTLVASGPFIHGVMNGIWRWYVFGGNALQKGDLKAEYTFSQGVPDGPFKAFNEMTGARIEGTVTGGFPPNLVCFEGRWSFNASNYFNVQTSFSIGPEQWLSEWLTGGLFRYAYAGAAGKTSPSLESPPPGKMTGAWRFFDRTGRLLGEDNLGPEGNGHFVFWAPNGDRACDGEIQEGVQEGDWILYDPGNRPRFRAHVSNGNVSGPAKPIPLVPIPASR